MPDKLHPKRVPMYAKNQTYAANDLKDIANQ